MLDLPSTIEEAQLPANEVHAGKKLDRRLVSAPPPDKPFPTPEPRHGKLTGGGHQGSLTSAAHVAELMTLAAVENALDELSKCYAGPWCLPRVVDDDVKEDDGSSAKKRKIVEDEAPKESPFEQAFYIPPDSHYLHGTIQAKRDNFLTTAPTFDLAILDPPWPNRSARRKKGKGNYSVADNLDSIRLLLSSIPVAAHLSRDGLVAVWVTNAGRFVELLTAPVRGIFAEWGVELIDEWTWLKVTSQGEPIVDVHSTWRKPWERLLIARKIGSQVKVGDGAGKVIISVPDLHSRKPNLRGMFEDVLGSQSTVLEVFARSLTAGWWSWGDDVVRFQKGEHWRRTESEEVET